MPRFEVEINGQRYEVEAPDEQGVSLAISQIEGAAPEKGNDALSVARTGVGGLIEGIPIAGPALRSGIEKAAAGTIAAFSDETYPQVLERIQKGNAEEKAANPWVDTGSQIAGGVAGTVPMVMAAPAAFGAGGGGLISRMALGGATGAGIGGIDSAVRSGGDLKSSATGGIIGLGAGAAGPVVGKAIGAGVRYLRGAADDALSGISKPAQSYVESQFSDPSRVAALRQELAGLGPEATLADVSPAWLGVARGAAAQPSMRDEIVNALVSRSEGSTARLSSDADRFLGSRVVPSQIEAGLEEGRNQFARNYGPVMAEARAVNTQPLAESLDSAATSLRGPERAANRQVRGFLNVPEVRVDGEAVLDPNPQALHATREAIDGLMRTETNGNVIRALTAARSQVDEALAEAAPGIKAVDARMHELYRQSEGLRQGRPILSNEAGALRPEEVEDMFVRGSQPQGEMVGPSAEAARMRDSVRAEFDRAVGTTANDDTALRKIVRGEGDWNREKLGYIYGMDNADGVLNAIDRESVFRDTANRVTRGSDTAMGSEFTKFLSEASKAGDVPADATIAGLGIKGVKKIAGAVLSKNAEANAGRYASEIGRLSVAQAAQRDAIVEALLKRGQARLSSSDPALQAIVTAITQASGRQTSR